MNHAVGDVGASNHSATGLDRLAHNRVTVNDLVVARLEHAREHLLDVFDQAVDDAVLADGHALELGRTARISFRLDVEGDNQRLRRDGQVDVVDIHVAEAGMDDFGARFRLVAELLQ